jgi:hypothetical protein
MIEEMAGFQRQGPYDEHAGDSERAVLYFRVSKPTISNSYPGSKDDLFGLRTGGCGCQRETTQLTCMKAKTSIPPESSHKESRRSATFFGV